MKMLTKDRKDRLGQNKGVEDILGHAWFKNLKIQDILAKKVPSPYVPPVANKQDLSNFDPEVVSESLKESILPEKQQNLILDKKDAFKDFGPLLTGVLAKGKARPGSASSAENN